MPLLNKPTHTLRFSNTFLLYLTMRIILLLILSCTTYCFPKNKPVCVYKPEAADSVVVYKEGEILINGYYNGKNIFVQNPFDSTRKRFCIQNYPKINGHITTRIIKSSAFEIDLVPFKFKTGDKVNIVIEHSIGCHPKVLNAEVLYPYP
jgi:hypothetical protein